MPPFDLWLRGRDDILTWWFGPGIGCRGSRVIPTVRGERLAGVRPVQAERDRRRATSRGRCRCSSSQTGGSSSSRSSSTPRRCSRSSGCPPGSTRSTLVEPDERDQLASSSADASRSRSSRPSRARAELEPRERVDRDRGRRRDAPTSQTIGSDAASAIWLDRRPSRRGTHRRRPMSSAAAGRSTLRDRPNRKETTTDDPGQPHPLVRALSSSASAR